MTIRPDLVLRPVGLDAAVADTKYKVLDDKGKLRSEDAYQLLAYCKRLRLRVGHLIYASGLLPTQPYGLLETDVRLEIHKVELGQDVGLIEADVARCAT